MTADRRANDVLHVLHPEPEAGGGFAVDVEVQVAAAHHPLGVGREGSGQRLDHGLDLLRQIRSSRVRRSGPPILMPTGVLMPVESMSMRVLMGMVQALVRPGNLDGPVHLGDQVIARQAGAPLARVLEDDGGLDHRQRCRVGSGLRSSDLAEHRLHFGKGADDLVGLLQDLLAPW